MNIHGIDAFTGEAIEIRFEKAITGVDPLLSRPEGKLPSSPPVGSSCR